MSCVELPVVPGDVARLPVLGEEILERGDAARNRRLLLAAAKDIVAEQGVFALTMDAVARRAGVGKGTVFRRFGDRSGLLRAVLDQTERELQDAFLFGPPPLGPGADPLDRLVAYGRAKLDMFEVDGEVLREAAHSRKRFTSAPHLVAVTHVSMLLRQARVRGHIRLLTETLLAMLDANLVWHQVHDLQLPLETIAENWEHVVAGLLREP